MAGHVMSASPQLGLRGAVSHPGWPLVSVVTPFRDEERFLSEAVESVRMQSYPRWELLLVDDGSTDGSTRIARGYADREPERIRYLEHAEHRSLGASASRNLGLERARGDLVAFLDADDLYLPFKLERQVALLRARPEAGLLYGNTLFTHSPDLPLAASLPDFVPSLGGVADRLHRPPTLLALLLRNEDTHPANCSLLIRRELCRRIGGFDERFELYEDTVFLAKAYLTTPVFVAGECSAVYRIHPDSTCLRAERAGVYHPTEPNPSRRAFLEWLADHIGTTGVRDPQLEHELRRALRPYHHPVRHRLASAAGRPGRRARALVRRARGRWSRLDAPPRGGS